MQNGETPQFTGKAQSGNLVVVAELAEELGFTDVNGRTPAVGEPLVWAVAFSSTPIALKLVSFKLILLDNYLVEVS